MVDEVCEANHVSEIRFQHKHKRRVWDTDTGPVKKLYLTSQAELCENLMSDCSAC